jgi:tRNA dimethylallyltransferase
MNDKDRPPVLVICGPTASGKSAAALALAEAMQGEIISADSMQVYRGMDIGTAKTPLAERRGIPHHLLDIREPGSRFSVADFAELASTAIHSIYSHGHRPIVCGGTGQYISALVEGLSFPDIPIDPYLREQLEHQADETGLAALYGQLSQIDLSSAARLSPNDRKRIIRALEIYQQTGITQTRHNEISRAAGPAFDFRCFCISHDRPLLYERIDRRVLAMVDQGLETEVRQLLARGLPTGSTCLQAIGYKEMLPYIQGQVTRPDMIAAIQQATRRYAKRQLTWFRHMDGLTWLLNHEAAQNVEIILANSANNGFIQ